MAEEWEVDEDGEPDEELRSITNCIIGAAIAVHKALGPGHAEITYENALELEFKATGIRYARQARFGVYYRGEQVGRGRIDFIVEEKVVLEIKACETLHPLFTSQVISYLKATRYRLALLINFNVRKLVEGIRRVAY
jgi:GxxExxY protein